MSSIGRYIVRRVQQTGGSTLIVSLPKEWVARTKLSKFDEVIMIMTDDGALHLIPKQPADETHEEFILHVRDDEKAEDILRDYISAYLVGYNIIRIRLSEKTTGLAHEIRQLIRRWLIGIEVVEETMHEIVTQFLPVHNSLPFRRAVERMGSIASAMQLDAISALVNLDRDAAAGIPQRDDEVDRFYHYIVRQLNLAVSNPAILKSLELNNQQDCLGYMLITKSIERAADHASAIASIVAAMHFQRNEITQQIAEVGYKANELFNNSIKALINSDKEAAKQVISQTYSEASRIDSMYARVYERVKRPVLATSYRLLLENIRRIAEYSSDIAEVVVNLSVRKPKIQIQI